MHYLTALEKRYSVKKFDPEYHIPEEKLSNILLAGKLAVSSLGMQPYRAVILCDKDHLAHIRSSFYNPVQIDSCSVMMIIIVRNDLTESYTDNYFSHISTVRETHPSALEKFRLSLLGYLKGKSDTELTAWATHQAYIFLSNLIFAAALEEIDTCPLEGFDKKAMHSLLNLRETEDAAVCLALGKRNTEDPASALKKVRKPEHLLYTHGL